MLRDPPEGTREHLRASDAYSKGFPHFAGNHLPDVSINAFESVLIYDSFCVTIKTSWDCYLIGTWYLEQPKSVFQGYGRSYLTLE